MKTTTQVSQDTATQGVLYMALELSNKTWRIALSDGNKRRHISIDAGDLMALQSAVEQAKTRFRLAEEAAVVSCYEAGRDGFWLHRYLLSVGTENVVVDSSSIEVNRRRRRVKTDRIDADKLLSLLIRHYQGERGMWSVVNVPCVEAEDARRLHREWERLKRERLGHSNRIKGLLITQGSRVEPGADFLVRLDQVTSWDGSALPADLKAELVREYERLKLVGEQIKTLKRTRRERLKNPQHDWQRQVLMLMALGAIGPDSAWLFVTVR